MEKNNALPGRPMKWYHYIAAFFAGVFLTNAVPHFIHGISGDAFPTPFADPPGKGLSSPLINMLWALFNIVLGAVLVKCSNPKKKASLLIFFMGMVTISILSSITFADKLP